MSVDPLFYLKEDWEVTTLGDVAARGGGSIQTGPFGSQLHASDYVDQGIPSIMPQNITTDRISEEGIARITEDDAERLSKYRVRTGDIVYSRRGDVERRALVREENDGWLCGTGCLKVSLGEGVVVPEYAAFYLSHPASKAWVVQHAVGATMPNLNTSILSALPFVLPPMEEQQQIANALSALDDKIELNRRMNETLEEMARALFRDWFVDFGPTRRQMEGATDPATIMGHAFPAGDMPEKVGTGSAPEINRGISTTKPLTAATLAPLFPAKLGDDGLPEGWTTEALGDLAENHSETMSFKGRDQVIFINTGDVLEGSFLHKAYSPTEGLPGQAKKIIKQGDILVSEIRPKNKRFAYVDFDAPDHVVSTKFMVVRSLGEISSRLLYFALKQPEALSEFNTVAESRSGTFPQITFSSVRHYLIPMAGLPVRDAFDDFLRLIFDKQKANRNENQTLAALRDLLLPKLMSGEIRLKDVEAAL